MQKTRGIASATAGRRVLRVLCPAALVTILAAIWALTVQTPSQTMALSGSWATAISHLTGLPFDRASWVARKVVHTVEFFPVGLFLALTVVTWSRDDEPRGRRRALIVLVLALCFCCSLGDQVHKTFVPGREFDALDMCFDAGGYALGIWLVCLADGSRRAKRAER